VPLNARIWLLATLASPLFPSVAWADDAKTSCLSDHEHGQVSRQAGQFESARASFASCTRDVCPAPVRKRCAELLAELDAAQPTIVIAVHDAEGHDILHGVTMTLDGKSPVDVPSTALRMDPGEHVLGSTAGTTRGDHSIVVREGEREKRVDIVLGQEAPRLQVATGLVAAPVAPTLVPARVRVSTGTRIWIAVSAVGLVGAAATSGAGWAVHSHLSTLCSPHCTSSQVAPLRVLWPASFAALGVGVASGAVALALLLRHTPSADQTGLYAAPDGVGWRFR
jgi:hypothetical protein